MTRYTHDCTSCTPLGEFNEFDLYHCGQGGHRPTVIARYGNDGPEYLSGMDSVHTPSLVEAQKRAVEKGLPVK